MCFYTNIEKSLPQTGKVLWRSLLIRPFRSKCVCMFIFIKRGEEAPHFFNLLSS